MGSPFTTPLPVSGPSSGPTPVAVLIGGFRPGIGVFPCIMDPNQNLGVICSGNVGQFLQDGFNNLKVADLASLPTDIVLGFGPSAVYLGVSDGATFRGVRTPSVFKTLSATALGNTALWVPTSGKRFRLQRFMIQVTGNATTAGGAVISISFQDGTTPIGIAVDAFVPSTQFNVGDDFISPWADLGNGFLSAALNNVLNVNLSAALTAGNVRITVCGTEE